MSPGLPLILGALVFASTLVIELVVRDFGFPDGHATELERAYAELWRFARVVAVAFGANLLALADQARRRSVRTWWLVSVAGLIALVAVAVWVGVDLRGRLDDGGGG